MRVARTLGIVFIRLRLKNWRSIDDARIDLAPFTVIVGRNSSGKSNIVDALVFSSELGRDASTAVSRRGGIGSIRRWSPSKPYAVSVEWRAAATEAGLDTDYTRHAMVLKSGKEGAWHFDQEELEARADGKLLFSAKRDKRGEADFERHPTGRGWSKLAEALPGSTSVLLLARQIGWLRSLPTRTPSLTTVRSMRPAPEEMRKPQPPSEGPRLTENGSNVATALREMNASERQDVVGAMQRIVPGLVDVQARQVDRYLTLAFTQQHRGAPQRHSEFAATEMSDGALRALAIVIAASQMARDELLIVEEPEVNLHPGAADLLYDVLHRASKRGAVLVTTHSPELLDRAANDRILVCDYVDGVTKIGPLASEQRALVREGLFTTAELMRSEELRRDGASARVVGDTP